MRGFFISARNLPLWTRSSSPASDASHNLRRDTDWVMAEESLIDEAAHAQTEPL
jgi:hypothetical protein